MLLTYARAFAVTAATVEYEGGRVMGLIIGNQLQLIDTNHQAAPGILSALEAFRQLCSDIPSLNNVCHQVDRITSKVNSGILPLALHVQMEALQNQLFDNLRDHFYYPVTAQGAALYSNDRPLGDRVYDAFPSARSNICDSARCAVLGQGTAAVFHAMRVMEVGLRVLSRRLKIEHAPSWDSHLKAIAKRVTDPHKTKSAAWKKQQALYLDLSGDLTAIKFAWRNPVMHIERDYNSSEANTIIIAVSGFINRMAENGFRETGKPIVSQIMARS